MRTAVPLAAAMAGLLAALLGAPVAAQNRGLTAPPDALGAARWQARFERDGSALPVHSSSSGVLSLAGSGAQTLRLMGDFQLDALRLGQTGGLRLTGGLLINLRPSPLQAWAPETAPTQPYAGIGYASGSARGEWGFSADLGLAASGLGVSLGNRGLLGLGVDGNLRDLRLQPMLRMGMNLAF